MSKYMGVKYFLSITGLVGFVFYQFLRSQDVDSTSDSDEFLKKRLELLAGSYDANRDGIISSSELNAWFQRSDEQSRAGELRELWGLVEVNGDGVVTYQEYRKYMSFMFEDDKLFEQRTERRYSWADKDKSGSLNPEEFALFVFPELSSEMAPLLYIEEMEERDRDGDNILTLPEFLGIPEESLQSYSTDPNYRTNIEYFHHLDKNHDSKLEEEELLNWISDNTRYYNEKAAALLRFADKNGDGNLDIVREILPNVGTFAESEITQYGDKLYYERDEL